MAKYKNLRVSAVHLGPKYGILQPGESIAVEDCDVARCVPEGVCRLNDDGSLWQPARKGKAKTAETADVETAEAETTPRKRRVNAG